MVSNHRHLLDYAILCMDLTIATSTLFGTNSVTNTKNFSEKVTPERGSSRKESALGVVGSPLTKLGEWLALLQRDGEHCRLVPGRS
jgi:hypothetical protein